MMKQKDFDEAYRRIDEAACNLARVINEVSHETQTKVVVVFNRMRTVDNEVAELFVDAVYMDRSIRFPRGPQEALEPDVVTY